MTKGNMHQRGEGELRWRREEHAHPLFRFASDIFIVLEVDGTIRYESPAIEKVLGYAPEELVGQNAFEYLHPEDLEEALDAFAEGIANSGATRRIEFRFRHADGSWRHLEGVGVNLLDEPDVEAIIVTSRDISERRRYSLQHGPRRRPPARRRYRYVPCQGERQGPLRGVRARHAPQGAAATPA